MAQDEGLHTPIPPANERDDDDEEPGFWGRLWEEICKALEACKDFPKM